MIHTYAQTGNRIPSSNKNPTPSPAASTSRNNVDMGHARSKQKNRGVSSRIEITDKDYDV